MDSVIQRLNYRGLITKANVLTKRQIREKCSCSQGNNLHFVEKASSYEIALVAQSSLVLRFMVLMVKTDLTWAKNVSKLSGNSYRQGDTSSVSCFFLIKKHTLFEIRSSPPPPL